MCIYKILLFLIPIFNKSFSPSSWFYVGGWILNEIQKNCDKIIRNENRNILDRLKNYPDCIFGNCYMYKCVKIKFECFSKKNDRRTKISSKFLLIFSVNWKIWIKIWKFRILKIRWKHLADFPDYSVRDNNL